MIIARALGEIVRASKQNVLLGAGYAGIATSLGLTVGSIVLAIDVVQGGLKVLNQEPDSFSDAMKLFATDAFDSYYSEASKDTTPLQSEKSKSFFADTFYKIGGTFTNFAKGSRGMVATVADLFIYVPTTVVALVVDFADIAVNAPRGQATFLSTVDFSGEKNEVPPNRTKAFTGQVLGEMARRWHEDKSFALLYAVPAIPILLVAGAIDLVDLGYARYKNQKRDFRNEFDQGFEGAKNIPADMPAIQLTGNRIDDFGARLQDSLARSFNNGIVTGVMDTLFIASSPLFIVGLEAGGAAMDMVKKGMDIIGYKAPNHDTLQTPPPPTPEQTRPASQPKSTVTKNPEQGHGQAQEQKQEEKPTTRPR